MQLPLVSICCLSYNHEAYIRECLDGFVMQKTNFPFEVLIHDDASTDDTQKIIREYEDKYPEIIKPIYQTENQHSKGVRISIVHNFSRAKGKYIAMCEGDDYWTDPNKLQRQVDFMEAHPEYSMCFHKAREIREGYEDFTPIFSDLKEKDYSGDELLRRWVVPTASAMFRRDIVPHIPVSPKFQVGDNVWWLTCSRHGKIRCLAGEGSVYRMTQTGWISSHKGMAWVDKLEIHMKALKEFFPEYSKAINDYLIQLQVNRFYYTINPLVKGVCRNFVSNPVKFPFRLFASGLTILKNVLLKKCFGCKS